MNILKLKNDLATEERKLRVLTSKLENCMSMDEYRDTQDEQMQTTFKIRRLKSEIEGVIEKTCSREQLAIHSKAVHETNQHNIKTLEEFDIRFLELQSIYNKAYDKLVSELNDQLKDYIIEPDIRDIMEDEGLNPEHYETSKGKWIGNRYLTYSNIRMQFNQGGM